MGARHLRQDPPVLGQITPISDLDPPVRDLDPPVRGKPGAVITCHMSGGEGEVIIGDYAIRKNSRKSGVLRKTSGKLQKSKIKILAFVP